MADPPARLEWDGTGGVTLWLDGQPQSYVAPEDPGLLVFEYVAHLGAVVDTVSPAGERLRVTHIGGAALTLPRYVEHTRPGSPQIVLEPAAAVTDLVRREIPLPRRHRIRVRATDGRTGFAALADGGADLVVLDAFARGSVPPELTTRECLAEVSRVLAPGGVVALNLPDEPARRYLARAVATLAAIGGFAELAALATHEVLKGRRYGNHVVVAGKSGLPLAALTRAVAACPFPSGVWSDARLRRLASGARPLSDADSLASPPPPDPGAWRAR